MKKHVYLFPDTHWDEMVEDDPNTEQVKELVRSGQLLKIQWSLCTTLKNPTSSKYNQRIKDFTADAASLVKMPWEQAFRCQPFIDVVSKALKAILEEEAKLKTKRMTRRKRKTRRGRPRPAAMMRIRSLNKSRRRRRQKRRRSDELGVGLQPAVVTRVGR